MPLHPHSHLITSLHLTHHLARRLTARQLEDEYDRRLSALTAALERKDMLLTALYDQTIVARLNGASKGGS